MEKVKKAIDAGVRFPTAVKESLGQTIEEFCQKNGLIRPDFSAMLNGRKVPDDRQLEALMKANGGTRAGWLDLWFKAARRRAATSPGAR